MKKQSNEQNPRSSSAFRAIRAIDYTVIFVRDMTAMRRLYEDIRGFLSRRAHSPRLIGYREDDNSLAMARQNLTAADVPTPNDSASLQLVCKVSALEVDQCAGELVRQRVKLLSPPTDNVYGHRTLF